MNIEITPFIKKNNLALTRSVGEIKQRFEAQRGQAFSFEPDVLIQFLPFADSKEFFKDEYVADVESGKQVHAVPTLEESVQEFVNYMEFAWGKAEDERGISASRSVQKLGAWLWLFGRDDLTRVIHDDDLYSPYGAPALIAVCDAMGIAVPNSLREFAEVSA